MEGSGEIGNAHTHPNSLICVKVVPSGSGLQVRFLPSPLKILNYGICTILQVFG